MGEGTQYIRSPVRQKTMNQAMFNKGIPSSRSKNLNFEEHVS